MPTYLYLHSVRTDTEQRRFRSEYILRHVDYELSRDVNSRGEITSGTMGGRIRLVMDGFGDETLFAWICSPGREENGEIVTMDPHERVIEKFSFARAKATGYRLHFDANIKEAVSVILTIEAGEIATDSDLYFQHQQA
jgi:hypothetical protein